VLVWGVALFGERMGSRDLGDNKLVLTVDEGQKGTVAAQAMRAQLDEGVECRVGIEDWLRQRPGR
jgi:hypothetical protein